jgi:predicted small secreted protein
MKKLFVLLVLLGMAFSAASCNMLKGAGEDIQDAGDAVKDATD